VLTFASSTKVFLVAGATDLRKSFDGLAGIATNEIHRSPYSGSLFVYCNARRNRLKVLFWEPGGFWVCAKRLEKGTFFWPRVGTRWIEMTLEELSLLLAGIDVKETKRRRWYHREEEGGSGGMGAAVAGQNSR